MQQLQKEFKDVFNGIGYYDGMFSLQLKPSSKTIPGTSEMCGLCTTKAFWRGGRRNPEARHNSTTRHRCDKRMVQQLHTGSLSQWKIQAMPGSRRLNQALIGPVHRGLTLNNILPKLNNAQYLYLIDASSSYHNLKLDEKIIIPDNVCLPIWQIQVQKITVWSSPCRWYVSRKKKTKYFKICPIYLALWTTF